MLGLLLGGFKMTKDTRKLDSACKEVKQMVVKGFLKELGDCHFTKTQPNVDNLFCQFIQVENHAKVKMYTCGYW